MNESESLQNIDEAGIYRCSNAPHPHLTFEASRPDIRGDSKLPPFGSGLSGPRWGKDGRDDEPRS